MPGDQDDGDDTPQRDDIDLFDEGLLGATRREAACEEDVGADDADGDASANEEERDASEQDGAEDAFVAD